MKRKGVLCYLIGLFALVSVMLACNNSDKSATNTTDTLNTNGATTGVDTSAKKSTTTNNAVKKKKGKATAAIEPVNKNLKIKLDKSGVYEMTEVRPSYPGGYDALNDYINNNFEYPEAAISNNTEGRVNVQLTIDQNGKVSNAKILGTKAGDGLDEEAVKIVSGMPKWTPGSVKGKPVKTNVIIPITFKIEE